VSVVTRWLVIGGGTAGCVVAARLSEDPGNDVVLVEAGPDHGPEPVFDRGGAHLSDTTRLFPEYEVVRRPGDEPQPYPQGFGLGGTTLINGTLATPDPEWFDLPHLMPLEQADRMGTLGTAVLDADLRARPALLTRSGGQRVTAADAYLRPALRRSNLMVVTGSPVVQLGLDRWRVDRAITADGVEYRADRFVLCAGAIGTPALLLRSRLDTPGIGHGLQDHPACTISIELNAGTDVDAPVITVVLDRPGSQIVPLNHLPGAPVFGALQAGLMSVTSQGRVSLPTPDAAPLVELGQLTTDHDVDGLVEVVAEAINLFQADSVKQVVRAAYIDDHGTPLDTIAGDLDGIRRWAIDNVSGFHHLTSSCREGIVTDPFGGVLGYSGLFICDASLFPRSPVRNPYLPVVQMAERLTRHWRSHDS
jgi:5-(hydroxymethyl)furfural/furfural oxidase